ncbi:small multi-drug export protein [Mariniblastus fucicola]|uniref:Small multi-drug export protein n=1 Tax=Mariniblastus fucicola TaxID=980251 RepID=A0A5B9P429_9BACT|nr:small multi-drug export protein [Mariniblastus fucicola]QEG21367.1 hypothetical protein MFFC18_12230 [Mariniblastus fucicola]
MEQLSETEKTENPYKATPGENIELAEDAHQLRDQLNKMFSGFEKQFRAERPILWWATLLSPIILSVTVLGLLWVAQGPGYALKCVNHALLTFFVLGRFVLLAGMEGEAAEQVAKIAMRPSELFVLVTYLDFIVALFVTFHMGVLFRIPRIGPKLAMLVWDGKFFMDSQPWIKRVAFLGLIGFVIFPTSTTGSIGGSIFGRLLGLSRWATVGGVLIGSLLGNSIMYAFAKQINKYLEDNWTLRIVGLLIIIVACLLLEWRYRTVKNKYMQDQKSSDNAEA